LDDDIKKLNNEKMVRIVDVNHFLLLLWICFAKPQPSGLVVLTPIIGFSKSIEELFGKRKNNEAMLAI
jgi:hypothetical protein